MVPDKNKTVEEFSHTTMSEDISKIIDCLQNTLDFEIWMYYVIYQELSLSDVETLIPHKSRPTVYRHIQNLLEANLILEDREEKVRGPIKAKIYRVSQQGLQMLPQITPEQIARMSSEEKSALFEIIRESLTPTVHFMKNILDRMVEYLQLLKPYPENELIDTMNKQDFHLNLNFLSQKQYQLFTKEFGKFMQAFIPKLIEEEKNNPKAEKTYAYIMGLFPIRKIIDRIVDEKQKTG